jgi:hypothetical protein
LKDRKFEKVLIALTDGEDNGSSAANNVNSCIALANANKIPIYTVGVGSDVADANLLKLAQSTGGQFFRANTSKELEDIYYKIFNLLSKNIELYFDILGNSTEPYLGTECYEEKYQMAGDTLTFPIFLKSVDNSGLKNQTYTLTLKYNKSMLMPLDSGVTFKKDGTIEIRGMNKSNLDSFPLINLKFLALVGDSECTDFKVMSIKWDIANSQLINSDSYCQICINNCVRNLRQIKVFTNYALSQNFPNPVTDNTAISVTVPEDGNYQLSLYNQMGELVEDNLIKVKLNKGENLIKPDIETLKNGNYFYILRTPSGNFSKMMTIIR